MWQRDSSGRELERNEHTKRERERSARNEPAGEATRRSPMATTCYTCSTAAGKTEPALAACASFPSSLQAQPLFWSVLWRLHRPFLFCHPQVCVCLGWKLLLCHEASVQWRAALQKTPQTILQASIVTIRGSNSTTPVISEMEELCLLQTKNAQRLLIEKVSDSAYKGLFRTFLA